MPTQLPTQHSSACQTTYRTGCPDLKEDNTHAVTAKGRPLTTLPPPQGTHHWGLLVERVLLWGLLVHGLPFLLHWTGRGAVCRLLAETCMGGRGLL